MKSSINVRYTVYATKLEQNRVTHLNRATKTVYPLGSQFKLPHGTSSLEQMCLLSHVNTKQRCEIECHGAARGSQERGDEDVTNRVFNG